MAQLGRLSAMGIQLSIDDYGTGHASLAYLRHLPVNVLKIDRSFVTDLATDAGDRAIVRSTIDLAHNLGLRVVAEGVEDEEALVGLTRLGCDHAQGFHLCRPMPPDLLIIELRRFARTSSHPPQDPPVLRGGPSQSPAAAGVSRADG
jgi:EAL domain-containing protein (putative c-di-GMP-specific phosphodiesterase class I)